MHVRSLVSKAVFCFAVGFLSSAGVRAARIPFDDLHAIAEICELNASANCKEPALAIVPAEFEDDRGFRAEWRPEPTVDRSAKFRARLTAFRALLAQTDFVLPARERKEVEIPFVLDIAEFFVVPARGGSADIGRRGAAIATRDGAASVVVPAGALSSRTHLSLRPEPLASASASLVGAAYAFGPETATFAVPARVTLAYDRARIPAGSDESEIAVVRVADGALSAVAGSTLDRTLQTVTAPVFSLGTFAAAVAVVTEGVIGAAGGTLTTPDGVRLDIPPFALDANQTITVTRTNDAGPDGVPQLSPVFRFAPEGIVFAQPITVAIPFTGDGTHARLFWTALGSADFRNVGGKAVGNTLVAQVTHFSSGVIGTGAAIRDVTGVQVNTWLTDTTSNNIPDDLSAPGSVEALLPTGTGGFTSIPGIGSASGTFTISGVPDGPYYLRTLTSYFVTASSTPDMGGFRLGRPDVITETDALARFNTLTAFNVGNLSPWQPDDFLEFFSTQANAFIFGLETAAFDGAPIVGDTALTDLFIDQSAFFSGGLPNLIDGTKGDRAVLTQLSTRSGLVGGQPVGPPYQSVSRIFQPAPFTQADGAIAGVGNFPANPADVFTDVSQANQVSVTLQATQFATLVTGLNPAFTPTNPRCNTSAGNPIPAQLGFIIQAEPGTGIAPGVLLSQFSSLPDLLIFEVPLAGPDAASGTMFYGTPLAGIFNSFGTIDLGCSIPFVLPGAVGPAFLSAGYRQNEEIGALTAAPVVPVLSGPQAVAINGADFFQPQAGIGASPTVNWLPPAIGSPTVYSLSVFRFWIGPAGFTRRALVANLQTSNTSVTLPNLLTNDPNLPTPQFFAFSLQAISSTNPNLADAPNRGRLPDAFAIAVSALMSP